MKKQFLIILGLTILSAKSMAVYHVGKTVCAGVVKNPYNQIVPISFEVEWASIHNDPPHSIEYEGSQDATVKMAIDGKSGTSLVTFDIDNYATRCGFNNFATAMVTLDHGLYAYNLVFFESYKQANCGINDSSASIFDMNSHESDNITNLTCL